MPSTGSSNIAPGAPNVETSTPSDPPHPTEAGQLPDTDPCFRTAGSSSLTPPDPCFRTAGTGTSGPSNANLQPAPFPRRPPLIRRNGFYLPLPSGFRF
jgi:hypothetical protein